MLLRTQQRELSELWGVMEAMPGNIIAQVEHVMIKHQEQERILGGFYFFKYTLCAAPLPAKLSVLELLSLHLTRPQTADWSGFWQRVRIISSSFTNSSASS